MSQHIRLLLVDHNTLLRRCLASTLNRRRDFEVVGDAGAGREAMSLARSLQPDVVVVDPDTPEGGDGIIEQLCQELPDAAVLALTDRADEHARDVLLAGARGCVGKVCEPDDLARAIKQVHAGELVVGSQIMDAILESLHETGNPTAEPAGLTERELDVLRLVAAGHTNPEIARQLFITEHTVKGHLARILGKLGLENRVQLATYAYQHGLADYPETDPPQPGSLPDRAGDPPR